MWNRPFCNMAVGLLLGICIAAFGKPWQILLFVASCAVAHFFWRKRDGYNIKKMVFFVGMFCLGWCRFTSQWNRTEQSLLTVSDGMQISLQGELCNKEIKNNQYVYELSSCVMGQVDTPIFLNRVLVYSDADIASFGEILVLKGKIELWRPASNEGNFDEVSFYRNRQIDFKLKDITLQGKYGRSRQWREALFLLKEKFGENYARLMGETTGGIMSTMVLGNKSLLDEEVKKLYQACGLSHILAISGVKTLCLVSPLSLESGLKWGFLGLHNAKKYIHNLCFKGQFLARCPPRFCGG